MEETANVVAASRRSGLGEIQHVRRRTGGELSEVYEVRGTCRDDSLIVKTYAPEWEWKQRKEVHVYGLVEPVAPGLIPRILDVRKSGEVDDLAYTVMTCLPGRPLSETAVALDASSLRYLYRQVGETVRAIHTLQQNAFGYLVEEIVDAQPDNAAYVHAQFSKTLAALSETDVPSELIRQVEQRLDAAGSALLQPVAPVLCHNDLHEGNLLVDDATGAWSLSGVIDVENAIAADPLHDLAKIDCYSIRDHPAKAAALAEGYRLVLDPLEQVRYRLYRIYHMIELLAWFHRIGQQERLAVITRQLTDYVSDADA